VKGRGRLRKGDKVEGREWMKGAEKIAGGENNGL
jgi:hypothetical protein